MKKRRWMALLLAGAMAATAGCSGGKAPEAEPAAKTAAPEETKEAEAAEAGEAGDAGAEERPYYVRDAEGVKGTLVVYNCLLYTSRCV